MKAIGDYSKMEEISTGQEAIFLLNFAIEFFYFLKLTLTKQVLHVEQLEKKRRYHPRKRSPTQTPELVSNQETQDNKCNWLLILYIYTMSLICCQLRFPQ